jgi:hypothetical protein
MVKKKSIRIGNASGYWGDDPKALERQITKGPLDYITMDFLAEVTMSILKKQKARNPSMGYAHHLIPMLKPVLSSILRQKTKLITNAGGMNPLGCAQAIHEMAQAQRLSPRIAVVYGDDIFPILPELERQGVSFENMETKDPFDLIRSKIQVANVYYGAEPIVLALKRFDPDIILTGRITDSGISLAAMIHELGWTDWDRIGSGIVASHLLECGSQVTGGNDTDWKDIDNFHDIGFPITEVFEDGSFILTKHPGTGGKVTVNTVREQLFYEVGTSKYYLTPDGVADFSTIQLTADGKDRVRVSSVKGFEPPPSYKVSMAFSGGYKVSGSLAVCGPRAREKAEVFSDIFWKRWNLPLKEKHTESIGLNALHRSLTGGDNEAQEILLRFSARDDEEGVLQQFARLIPSLILGGPPGICVLGGVAKPQEIISYWPALIDRKWVRPRVALLGNGELIQGEECPEATPGGFKPLQGPDDFQIAHSPVPWAKIRMEEEHLTYTLFEVCIARSGDKGDMANIGLCARSPLAYELIKEYVTAQRVKTWFQDICKGRVTRFALDNLFGLNFMLEQSLGGGGSSTLQLDAQGKGLAQALLKQKIPVPRKVLEDVRERPFV